MAYQDRRTRLVNVLTAIGQTAILYDNPSRSLLNGEFIRIGTDTTYYQVSACTTTGCTVTPALVVAAADNSTITREDKYAIMPFEDLLDQMNLDDLASRTNPEGYEAEIYKMSLRGRDVVESVLDSPVISRSYTELFSIEAGHVGLKVVAMNYEARTKILLPMRPLISVDLLEFGDGLGTFSTIASTGYTYDIVNGILHYPGGFPAGNLNVRVTWTAGYASCPHYIQECFLDVMQFLFSKSKMGWKLLTQTSAQQGSNVGAAASPFRTLKDLTDYLEDQLFDFKEVSI